MGRERRGDASLGVAHIHQQHVHTPLRDGVTNSQWPLLSLSVVCEGHKVGADPAGL